MLVDRNRVHTGFSQRMAGRSWAAFWGVFGVLAVLGAAVVRLLPIGLEPLQESQPLHVLAAYGLSLAFFGYTEGFKAFHRGFCPRVAARAHHLRFERSWTRRALAPLFCMGFFGARRRRLVVSWGLALGLVGLIALVKVLPQPTRGVIDLGVVVALAAGMLSLVFHFVRGFQGQLLAKPELPEDESPGDATDAPSQIALPARDETAA